MSNAVPRTAPPRPEGEVRRRTGSPRSLLAELAEIGLLALGLYLVIQFAVQTVHVIGLSMYPTLDNDDYLIASKLDYRFHAPDRGDIIILQSPIDESKDYIKRVIGLPGERLLIRDGHVYINGQLLRENYLRHDEPWTINANWPLDSSNGVVVPPNYYFVMGDNRNRSSDSRSFGPIRRDEIAEKAWLRVWPVTHAGPTNSRPQLQQAAA
jgi:signal peptidase I